MLAAAVIPAPILKFLQLKSSYMDLGSGLVMIKRDRRGIFIAMLEVKFLDRRKTNYCESICQECFH